jgi:hypothetical protein
MNSPQNKGHKALIVFIILGAIASALFYNFQSLQGAVLHIINSIRIDSGLVGYWDMDGKNVNWATGVVSDVSGTGNNLKQISLSTTTSPMPGITGQALRFSGASPQRLIKSSVSGLPTGANPFTMSAWLFPFRAENPDVALNFGSDATSQSVHFIFRATNKICFDRFGVSNLACYTGVAPNNWSFVVGTYDGSTMRLYVNGTFQASSNQTLNIGTGEVSIGGWNSQNLWFNGIIDEVRIYNRALSGAEIQYLYRKNAREFGSKVSPTTPQFQSVTTKTGDAKATNPITFSHTVNAGNNLILLVKVGYNTANTGSTCTSCKVNSITYAGRNLTQAHRAGVTTEASPYNGAEIWYLTNPPPGSGTVSVTYDLPTSPFATLNTVIAAETWSNVDSTNPFGNMASTTGTDSTISSVSVNSSGSEVVTDIISARANHLLNIGANQTLIFSATQGTGGGTNKAKGSRKQSILGSPVTLSWTGTDTIDDEWAMDAVALRPANLTLINSSQNNKFTNGLVGFWSFNGPDINWATGVVSDVSGNGNNGKQINMSTTTSPIAGISGQGLKFNGSNNSINVPDATSLNFDGSKDFTISAWIKPTALDSSQRDVVSKGDNSNWGYDFLTWTDNTFAFRIIDTTPSAAEIRVFTGALTANQWQHVVGVYTANTNLKIYLNGVLANTTNTDSSVSIRSSVGTSMSLGSFNNSSQFFRGELDEIRIYNRALSGAEVFELYKAGRR